MYVVQYNSTALHWACIGRHFSVVETLIIGGADIYIETNVSWFTVDGFSWSCRNCYVEWRDSVFAG
jgi:hypothetical protein